LGRAREALRLLIGIDEETEGLDRAVQRHPARGIAA